MLEHLRLLTLEMQRQISLTTARVSGLSSGAGRTPVPEGLGQYLQKYGVQYCVLLFAFTLCPGRIMFPTLQDPGRQLPRVMQILLLALPGIEAGRQASGQMATWMGSRWAGLGRTEPGATIRVGKRQKEPLLTFYLSQGLHLTLGSTRAASMAPSASIKWPLKWEGK